MLLDYTKSYAKYLEQSAVNEDLFHFTGKYTASKEDKEAIIDLDEVNVELEGTHLIDNYEDLEDGTKDRS